MSNFVNTIDQLGDEIVFKSIINKSITEFNDDTITTIGANAFFKCINLQKVKLPNVSSFDTQAFYGCTNLKVVDTKSTLIGGACFMECSSLETLILRSNTICTTTSSTNIMGTKIENKTGYIYVPRALIEDYKVATNWTKIASQFRALEDYTVDGTIMGELDPKKVDPLTWTKVQTFIANGTYKDNLAIGDTLPLDLGSEGVIDMEIVAFDTDDKADGSGKAPITWIAKELLVTKQMMDDERSSSSVADWPTEPLYTYLQDTIKPLIPLEVLNAIVPVTKKYYYSLSSSGKGGLRTSSDDIWIPSMAELCGVDEDGYYYSEAYANDESRIKLLYGSTYGMGYWTRTPSSRNDFYDIWGRDGTYNTAQSNISLYIALGFCM